MRINSGATKARCRPFMLMSARIKSDGLAMSALLPLYPRKPTFIVSGGMSTGDMDRCRERALCQPKKSRPKAAFRSQMWIDFGGMQSI